MDRLLKLCAIFAISTHMSAAAAVVTPARADLVSRGPKFQTIPLTLVYESENHARFDLEYIAKIHVGTPPQSFGLFIDTATPDTHIYSKSSGNPPPWYEPQKSSTFVNVSKPYLFEYGGPNPAFITNVTGYVVRDTISFGAFSSIGQTFAVATGSSPGILDSHYQGNFGLAYDDAVSGFHKPVYVQNLISKGLLASPQFGLHLKRAKDLDAPPATKQDGEATIANGGEITIGGFDKTMFHGVITYKPVTVKAFWQIALDGIVLNGHIVSGTAMDAAVDSGSNIIVLPPAVATTFFSEIPGSTVIEEGIWAIPCNTTLDVRVKIAGRTFPLKVEDLSLGYADAAGAMCVVGAFGIDAQNANSKGTYPSGKPDVIILGLPFMKSVYSIFDYSGGGRVGFANLKNNGKGPYVGPIGASEKGNAKTSTNEVKKLWSKKV